MNRKIIGAGAVLLIVAVAIGTLSSMGKSAPAIAQASQAPSASVSPTDSASVGPTATGSLNMADPSASASDTATTGAPAASRAAGTATATVKLASSTAKPAATAKPTPQPATVAPKTAAPKTATPVPATATAPPVATAPPAPATATTAPAHIRLTLTGSQTTNGHLYPIFGITGATPGVQYYLIWCSNDVHWDNEMFKSDAAGNYQTGVPPVLSKWPYDAWYIVDISTSNVPRNALTGLNFQWTAAGAVGLVG